MGGASKLSAFFFAAGYGLLLSVHPKTQSDWCKHGSFTTDCYKYRNRIRYNTTDIKVILPGASQTATTSVTMALREMGIMAWHADDYSVFIKKLMYNEFEARDWIKYATKCRVEAISLEPIMDLFPFVLEHSPGAKVVLTQRTFKAWRKSFVENGARQDRGDTLGYYIFKASHIVHYVELFDGLTGAISKMRMEGHPFFGKGVSVQSLLYRGVCNGYAWPSHDSDARGSRKLHAEEEAYLGLQDEVRRLTPKGDLLEFDPKTMGFPELADFLGLPAPNKSFPHPRSKHLRTNEQVYENFFDEGARVALWLFVTMHPLTYNLIVFATWTLLALVRVCCGPKRVTNKAAAFRHLKAALAECPVVVVLGDMEPAQAMHDGKTLFDAGVRVFEVALTSPWMQDTVALLKKNLPADAVIVAGSAMSSKDVDAAAAANVKVLSSPHAQPWLLSRALKQGLLPIACTLTAKEAVAALNHGASALLLQPAEQAPPEVLAHMRRVLPEGVLLLVAWAEAPQAVAAYRSAGASGVAVPAAQLRPEGGPAGAKKRLKELLAQR